MPSLALTLLYVNVQTNAIKANGINSLLRQRIGVSLLSFR